MEGVSRGLVRNEVRVTRKKILGLDWRTFCRRDPGVCQNYLRAFRMRALYFVEYLFSATNISR